jgi:hypothetical protein
VEGPHKGEWSPNSPKYGFTEKEQYFLQICRGDEGISTAEESCADALAKALAESKSESEMLSLFYDVAPLGSCEDTGG